TVSADPAVAGQQSYVIDRGEQVHTPEAARNLAAQQPQIPVTRDETDEDFVEEATHEENAEVAAAEPEPDIHREGGDRDAGDTEGGAKRRGRRGRARVRDD